MQFCYFLTEPRYYSTVAVFNEMMMLVYFLIWDFDCVRLLSDVVCTIEAGLNQCRLIYDFDVKLSVC